MSFSTWSRKSSVPFPMSAADIVGAPVWWRPTMPRAVSNGIETYQVNPWSRWAGGPCPCPCRCRRSQQRLPQRESRPKRRVLFSLEFPFLHATRCTLRASLHRWSPAEANGSPAPETVGHFKGDCVLGDTVTRRAQQNLPESGSRSAPRHPPLPVYFSSSALRLDRLLRLRWLTACGATPSHPALPWADDHTLPMRPVVDHSKIRCRSIRSGFPPGRGRIPRI